MTHPLTALNAAIVPQSQYAAIREAECIGCAKCIQACPVDAILGSAKNMHTVITMECIGCELCVAPCPVDCIDMLAIPLTSAILEKPKIDNTLTRYHARQKRLTGETIDLRVKHTSSKTTLTTLAEKQAFIQAAVLRATAKKIK